MKMTRFWKSSPHMTYNWANNTVKKSEIVISKYCTKIGIKSQRYLIENTDIKGMEAI